MLIKSAFLSFVAAGLFLVSSCGADNKPVTVGAEGPGDNMETTTTDTTTTPATAGAYVCPMHPEVTSDKPGDCPKCGMALVKQ
ncbi:heavy metal-binding domain-containing protein [Hymenobacter profundi]|uniref:Heavy metal binding domain-containing protein n=1 Tax=Hymenobacter profundi TaxID=1982110 RepID=A0ABS6WUT3_9BACT|nr:heavy metal-binding domain-containing protein [Hymenobacter profundi]MBW3127326.1 hypothetical protein [Hymenobacter profundi]